MKKVIAISLAVLMVLAFTTFSTGAGWGQPKLPLKVGAGQTYATINDALAAAADGDTILVFPGTYDETINIENFNGLTIKGWGFNVILKPSAALPWNMGGYTNNRQVVVRVLNSTNINIEGMVMDFDLVKNNAMFGVVYFDSTGSFTGNLVKNMSAPDASGYYTEIGTCFRAPDFTDASRANVNISRNTFIDAGRVAILTHNYVNANITGNVFYKTFDDFGYAVEMGSASTGTISMNTIYGYDTPALSDNSNSGGLYIENCFTSPDFGFTGHVNKRVTVTGNNIYNCQWGIYIGNEYDDYAGDVDIMLMLNSNNIHDNTDGGVIIADEDKEFGSSVTVNGLGNTVVNNGGYGYYIYTNGDGDIKVKLSGEKIGGQDTGVYVEDTANPSSSSYSVQFYRSDIVNNATYGINNTVAAFTVDASINWWGDKTGPFNAAANPSGTGNAVSDYVKFAPWQKWPNMPGFFFKFGTPWNPWNWGWSKHHIPEH